MIMRRVARSLIGLLIAAMPLVVSAGQSRIDFSKLPWDPPSTFSILGYDPDTGEIGAAVQSRVFSAGNGVLWAEAGVGAVASLAIVDVSYGLCRDGADAGFRPQDAVPGGKYTRLHRRA